MMTVEEQKAEARKEKETIVRIMLNCYPTLFGNPHKAREDLLKKTLSQLRKKYEDVMKEKWVYSSES